MMGVELDCLVVRWEMQTERPPPKVSLKQKKRDFVGFFY